MPELAASPLPAPASSISGPLPEVSSPLSGVEIVAKLDAAARRGKLPGFHKHIASNGGASKSDTDILFILTDFGTPFESILEARATPSGSGSILRFTPKLKPTMPWIFIATLVLSVWPGVWLTDSMIRTYFTSYSWSFWGTCAWYLPLTILPTPFAISSAFKKSRASAHKEALALIETIRSLVASSAP